MLKQDKKIIDVASVLAVVIGSRDIADHLKNIVKNSREKAIDLDFQNVEFISRSASHELLLIKEDLRRQFINKKDIFFINTNEAVTEMFRVIAANRAVPKAPAIFNPLQVSIQSLEA